MSERNDIAMQPDGAQPALAASVPGAPNPHEEEAAKLLKKLKRSEKSIKGYQWLIVRLLILVVIVWVLFFQIVGLTHMPSGDMFPRVDAGDLVLFYRIDKDVHAQDVVVIEKATPDSNGDKPLFISRVVAKEGDTVDFKENHLIVNGNTAIESDIFYPTPVIEGVTAYPVTLGAGECYVLGDKRAEATDSRYFGPVKQEELLGTVITIVRRNNL